MHNQYSYCLVNILQKNRDPHDLGFKRVPRVKDTQWTFQRREMVGVLPKAAAYVGLEWGRETTQDDGQRRYTREPVIL